MSDNIEHSIYDQFNQPIASGYDGLRKVLMQDGSVDDVVRNMQRIAKRDAWQVELLAQKLEGNTIKETTANIWNWIRRTITYKLDKKGIEELRTPARSLMDKATGVDCDDYTILVSALLITLSIPHLYRIVSYSPHGKFEHVYPVALHPTTGKEYVIDIVPEIPTYHYEAQGITNLKDYKMEIHELSGIGEIDPVTAFKNALSQPDHMETMGAIDTENAIEQSELLENFSEVQSPERATIVLSGTPEIADMFMKALLAQAMSLQQDIESEMEAPNLLSQVSDLEREHELITDVIDNWEDSAARQDAILDARADDTAYPKFYDNLLTATDALEEAALQDIDESDMREIALALFPSEDMRAMQELDNLEGIGRLRFRSGRLSQSLSKLKDKVKSAVSKVVKTNPKNEKKKVAIEKFIGSNFLGFPFKALLGYLKEDQLNKHAILKKDWEKGRKALKIIQSNYTKAGGDLNKLRALFVQSSKFKRKFKKKYKSDMPLSGIGAIPPFLLSLIPTLIKELKKVFENDKKDENGALVDDPASEESTEALEQEVVNNPAPVLIPTRPISTQPNMPLPTITAVQTADSTRTNFSIPNAPATPNVPSAEQEATTEEPKENAPKKGMWDSIKAHLAEFQKAYWIGGISLAVIGAVLGAIALFRKSKKRKKTTASKRRENTRPRMNGLSGVRRKQLGAAKKTSAKRKTTTRKTTARKKPVRRSTTKKKSSAKRVKLTTSASCATDIKRTYKGMAKNQRQGKQAHAIADRLKKGNEYYSKNKYQVALKDAWTLVKQEASPTKINRVIKTGKKFKSK